MIFLIDKCVKAHKKAVKNTAKNPKHPILLLKLDKIEFCFYQEKKSFKPYKNAKCAG